MGKKAADISADGLTNSAVMLSVFLRDPQFLGQTKDRLVSADAKSTEQAVRDRFDRGYHPGACHLSLKPHIDRAEERRAKKEVAM